MFRLRSLAVVVLLVASSLVTLKLMGWSQWIQAILVIAVELSLGVVLHEMVEASARRARADRQLPEATGHNLELRPILNGDPAHDTLVLRTQVRDSDRIALRAIADWLQGVLGAPGSVLTRS